MYLYVKDEKRKSKKTVFHSVFIQCKIELIMVAQENLESSEE